MSYLVIFFTFFPFFCISEVVTGQFLCECSYRTNPLKMAKPESQNIMLKFKVLQGTILLQGGMLEHFFLKTSWLPAKKLCMGMLWRKNNILPCRHPIYGRLPHHFHNGGFNRAVAYLICDAYKVKYYFSSTTHPYTTFQLVAMMF